MVGRAGKTTPGLTTITSTPMSQCGVILGTAVYMPPGTGQSGKPVDRRADIWAFGVVLFEVLTGRSLYMDGNAAETLANVIEREPDLGALPGVDP